MHNLKELEADVLAATPDEAKQKRMEISLEDLEKGRDLLRAAGNTKDHFGSVGVPTQGSIFNHRGSRFYLFISVFFFFFFTSINCSFEGGKMIQQHCAVGSRPLIGRCDGCNTAQVGGSEESATQPLRLG